MLLFQSWAPVDFTGKLKCKKSALLNPQQDLDNLEGDFFISDGWSPDEIQAIAHNRLGEVLSILKGVLRRYPPLNSTEILTSAGIVIKKVKEHNYHELGEPHEFMEATDQLALAFSSRYVMFFRKNYIMSPKNVKQ